MRAISLLLLASFCGDVAVQSATLPLAANQVRVYNPNIYNRTRRTMSNRAAVREALKKKGAGQTAPIAAGATTFREGDPPIAPRKLALKHGSTPAEQQRLEKLFLELLESYRERLKKAGAPTNDVSRAAAYLISASYAVAHEERIALDDSQFGVFRKQMAEIYAGDQSFQRTPNNERQEMFEEYGITGAWIDSGYQTVKQAGDRTGMKQWQTMARQNFESMVGSPPERVIFTSSGLQHQ